MIKTTVLIECDYEIMNAKEFSTFLKNNKYQEITAYCIVNTKPEDISADTIYWANKLSEDYIIYCYNKATNKIEFYCDLECDYEITIHDFISSNVNNSFIISKGIVISKK